MSGLEQFVVITFSGDDGVFVVTKSDGTVLTREYAAIKGDVHGVLSTEEEIDEAKDDTRYAVPVDLAREVFGWDIT
jgi:hypothetical protein